MINDTLEELNALYEKCKDDLSPKADATLDSAQFLGTLVEA